MAQAKNTPPDLDERKRMWELYQELGEYKAVAEHSDIDYSRESVRNWVNRIDDAEEEWVYEVRDDLPDNPEDITEGDYTAEEPQGDSGEDHFETPDPKGQQPTMDLDTSLVETDETPNDILFESIKRDPKLGEDELEYVKSYAEQWGQLSTDNVRSILNEIKISNKHMTINRVVNRYSQTVNQKLRKDQTLQYEESWAEFLFKETGDPQYAQYVSGNSGQGAGMQGGNSFGQQGNSQVTPPNANPMGPQGQQSNVTPPAAGPMQQPQSHGQNQQAGGGTTGQGPHRQQPQQPANPQPQPASQPNNGQGEALKEMTSVLNDLTKEITSISERVSKLEQGGTGQESSSNTDSVNEAIQTYKELQNVMGEVGDDGSDDEKIQRLEQQINNLGQQLSAAVQEMAENQSSTSSNQQDVMQQAMGDNSDMMAIAQMAQSIDDEEIIDKLIQMQTDPDVIEAEAKRREAEKDGMLKETVAQSLSPETVEKAIDLLTGLSGGGSQQQQPQPQRQNVQQVQQQPQTQQRQQAQKVERVEDDENLSGVEEEQTGSSDSPLREEGREEMEQETAVSKNVDVENEDGDDE